ncbi:hypothetical protein GCM10023331_04610 [Algivirga pacifica]|uniref:MORN repeat-containing protein n=2 Tax=Algivirga pacifica TaxID=1162670 RepID=A0ABP9D3A8_9BACT
MRKIFILFFLTIVISPLFAQNDVSNQVAEGDYQGDLDIHGNRKGTGTYTWKDGTVYEGKWQDNLMHGRGVLHYADGSTYEGYFAYGKKHGYGVFTWADGDKYTGGFKEGKMHGRGVLEQTDGSVHTGIWREGKSNGEGDHVYADGSKYIGEWKDNLRHGKGIMLYADGRIEQGKWMNGDYLPCDCSKESYAVMDAFKDADAVFVGKVISVETADDASFDQVGFEVQSYWKGELYPGRKIYLFAAYSSCDFVFFEGDEYFVYAKKHEVFSNLYYADKCGRTRKMGGKFDRDEIAFLKEQVNCLPEDMEKRPTAYDFSTDPVCGCDGNTYKNAYKAARAGVGSWQAGKCNE